MLQVPTQNSFGQAVIHEQASFLGTAPSRLLRNGLKTNGLRTNLLLRKDEWISLDTAIVNIARRLLNGVADLRAAGLTRTLGGLGTLMAEWEQAGDMNPARVDMSAVSRSDEDNSGLHPPRRARPHHAQGASASTSAGSRRPAGSGTRWILPKVSSQVRSSPRASRTCCSTGTVFRCRAAPSTGTPPFRLASLARSRLGTGPPPALHSLMSLRW